MGRSSRWKKLRRETISQVFASTAQGRANRIRRCRRLLLDLSSGRVDWERAPTVFKLFGQATRVQKR